MDRKSQNTGHPGIRALGSMLLRPALIIKIQAGISKLSGVSWFMVHGSKKPKHRAPIVLYNKIIERIAMDELLVEAYDLFYLVSERLDSELKKAGVSDDLTQAVKDLIQLQGLANRSYYSNFRDMGALTRAIKKNQAFIDNTDNKTSNQP
mgnify:CR=1 FL=1|jgi:hypothetical protein